MAGKNNKDRLNEYRFEPYERTRAQKSYFFLEGKLYKKLRQDRANNILVARSYPEEQIVEFLLSEAKRKMKNAYSTPEVARMLNRTREAVQKYVNNGFIKSPIKINKRGRNTYGHPFSAMKWSEEDILELHEHLLNHGGGRPRKDGMLYAAARLPSRQELLAVLKSSPMFYMQSSDGSMIPVWSAYNEV